MKNTIKVLGIVAIVAVIGFMVAACDQEPESDHTTAGRLTITGLSSYSGRQISASTGDEKFYVMGTNADNGSMYATVSGDSVTLFVWTTYQWEGRTKLQSFTGNNQNVEFTVDVGNTRGTVTVNFNNGVGSGVFVPNS